jgi:predicted transcriptional regulator
MNKKQEKIAENVICFLIECNGMTTSQSLMNKFKELNNNRFAVIGGLKDLELIKDVGSNSYRLTEKGWKFKSFKKLYRDDKLKLIGTKTVIITAILTVIINLLQILL